LNLEISEGWKLLEAEKGTEEVNDDEDDEDDEETEMDDA